MRKRSRVLISSASCSPSLWTGNSDGSLPFAAEGSPFSAGLNMTPSAGQTFAVAYGQSSNVARLASPNATRSRVQAPRT